MTIQDRIKSLREGLGVEYIRPPIEKLDKMCEDLKMNEEALEYLHIERGLSDETIKHFRLGYDQERDAIAIPIFKKGELVNIKYRMLHPDKNKYSGEKGAEVWVFNEDGANVGLQKQAVLIVEGEFDCMSAWQAGFKSVVSTSAGKDSYGIWLELLDPIPVVFIAYDNDKAGQGAAIKLAERIGTEKCFEIQYPEGTKDANEFFKSHTRDDFNELKNNAKPFYKYQFKGIGDVIKSLREDESEYLKTEYIPDVDFQKDWIAVISGVSNVGKTSYCMNVADDFTKKGLPVLVMPFERGTDSVGQRFLQVKFNKTRDDFKMMDETEWQEVIKDCVDLPVYFSVPKREQIVDTIIKSKRIFNTGVVIIDHLDYVVRHVSGNREAEIANTIQNLKRVAEEHGVLILIVTHIRKIDSAGAEVRRKPNIEDLKGSASLYQDPECVVMLHKNEDTERIEVAVLKNKGKMTTKEFTCNFATGKMELSDFDSF
jgi:5S rRNA maturation endonuclease (ribonuclease M5)